MTRETQLKLQNIPVYEQQPGSRLLLFRIRDEYALRVKKLIENKKLYLQPYTKRDFAELFLVLEEGRTPLLVKRIWARKEADYLRRYFNSQGKREFEGSMHLAAAGVRVPAPIGYAVNLLPWEGLDSVFISEFVPDTITLAELLEVPGMGIQRECLMKMAAADLRRMTGRQLFHKDAHAGNVLVTSREPRALYWIDNDVARSRGDHRKTLLQRWFQKSGALEVDRTIFEHELGMVKPERRNTQSKC